MKIDDDRLYKAAPRQSSRRATAPQIALRIAGPRSFPNPPKQTMINSYSKIYSLGHPAIADLAEGWYKERLLKRHLEPVTQP